MKIVADMDGRSLREQAGLVRKYIREHKNEQRDAGTSRWFARLRLELAAWKYAHRELKKTGGSLHKLYSSRCLPRRR